MKPYTLRGTGWAEQSRAERGLKEGVGAGQAGGACGGATERPTSRLRLGGAPLPPSSAFTMLFPQVGKKCLSQHLIRDCRICALWAPEAAGGLEGRQQQHGDGGKGRCVVLGSRRRLGIGKKLCEDEQQHHHDGRGRKQGKDDKDETKGNKNNSI
ncbi:hypothetical protein Pcinc_028310 [Petrolisthes cinctipes]|uniref:Uncharacterized protein n=1 Tax=Petrolisthes cinctipes TaxID=88211 RepID=A0AAE1F244_PETCI|nr:hypothetical protein Pcinc_028310 [Petrolisthes cinctipes]